MSLCDLVFLRVVPQRDSWEQSAPEAVSQVEPLCTEGLTSVGVPPAMPSPEPPSTPPQFRPPSRGSSMGAAPSGQPYTLHPLEDVHYHSLSSSSPYPTASSSFPCPPYMSSPVSDLVSKMVAEEDSHGNLPPSTDGHPTWPKEEGVSSWSPYELRRAY